MLVICQMFHLRFIGNLNRINFLYNHEVDVLARDAFSASTLGKSGFN